MARPGSWTALSGRPAQPRVRPKKSERILDSGFPDLSMLITCTTVSCDFAGNAELSETIVEFTFLAKQHVCGW